MPLSESTVGMGQSCVIYCYQKNWHCPTYLIPCHRGGISCTARHILLLDTGEVSHSLADISYSLSQGRYLIHICIVRKQLNVVTLWLPGYFVVTWVLCGYLGTLWLSGYSVVTWVLCGYLALYCQCLGW